MKKMLALVLSLVLILGLVACTGKKSQSQSKEESYIFGLALNALDENTTRGYNLFMEAANTFLAENPNVHIEVIMTNAEGNAEKQMTNAEALVAKGCDVIRVDAADTTAGITLCDMIIDAGIPVLEIRGVKNDRITVSASGYDSYSMGLMYGAELEKLLLANPNLKMNIGYIHGNPAQSETLNRISGAEMLAEKYPNQVTLTDVKYGNWQAAEAMAIVEDWLVSKPEMNVICAASDEMAVGAINVLRAAGVLDKFLVTSIDGNVSGLNAVAEGSLLITVMMNQRYVMFRWFDVMLQLARGEQLPREIRLGTSGLFPATLATLDEALILAK